MMDYIAGLLKLGLASAEAAALRRLGTGRRKASMTMVRRRVKSRNLAGESFPPKLSTSRKSPTSEK